MILDWHINERVDPTLIRQFLPPIQTYTRGDTTDPLWLQLQERAPNGWNPLPAHASFEMSMEEHLLYPEMPPLEPLAMAYHLGERILVYPAGFVAIVQLNGDYSIARVL
jgi:hypothetical protein